MRRELIAASHRPDQQPATTRVRIVLDTNVVFSALLWRGRRHHLLTAIGQRSSIYIYSSPARLEELAGVLTRPTAIKRLTLIGKSARAVLADYVTAIELVDPVNVPRVVLDDVDDDQVIAAAVAGRGDLIVSGDAHLLNLKSFRGIEIVTAAIAIERVGSVA